MFKRSPCCVVGQSFANSITVNAPAPRQLLPGASIYHPQKLLASCRRHGYEVPTPHSPTQHPCDSTKDGGTRQHKGACKGRSPKSHCQTPSSRKSENTLVEYISVYKVKGLGFCFVLFFSILSSLLEYRTLRSLSEQVKSKKQHIFHSCIETLHLRQISKFSSETR